MSLFINSQTRLKRHEKQPLKNKFSSNSIKITPKKNSFVLSSKTFYQPSSAHLGEPKLKRCGLQLQLKELQAVNKSLVRSVAQYKKKCENELARIGAELKEYKKLLRLSHSKGGSLQRKFFKEIEDLKAQIRDKNSEIERKEEECQDVVRKISNALKNVQNKYALLEMKHENMAKRAFKYQTQLKEEKTSRDEEILIINSLKERNCKLKRLHEKQKQEFNKKTEMADNFLDTTETFMMFSPFEEHKSKKELKPEVEEVVAFEVQTKDPNLTKIFKERDVVPAGCEKINAFS